MDNKNGRHSLPWRPFPFQLNDDAGAMGRVWADGGEAEGLRGVVERWRIVSGAEIASGESVCRLVMALKTTT